MVTWTLVQRMYQFRFCRVFINIYLHERTECPCLIIGPSSFVPGVHFRCVATTVQIGCTFIQTQRYASTDRNRHPMSLSYICICYYVCVYVDALLFSIEYKWKPFQAGQMNSKSSKMAKNETLERLMSRSCWLGDQKFKWVKKFVLIMNVSRAEVSQRSIYFDGRLL